MKRVIIVCFCLSLLSLLIIPAFAENRVSSSSDDSVRSISPNYSYTSLSFPRYISAPSSSFTEVVSGYFYSFDQLGEKTLHNFSSISVSSSGNLVVAGGFTLYFSGGDRRSSWDGILYFSSSSVLSNDFVEWYNSLGGNLDSSVSGGVSSFIGWTGSVLSDIITSPYVLPLVGLAVALFCVLPFGITTIKNLMKGY